ncbi:17525_t:CDS:1, partial [Funneliformis caledonium]
FRFLAEMFRWLIAIIWLINDKEPRKQKTKVKYLVEELNLDGKKELGGLVPVQFVTLIFEAEEQLRRKRLQEELAKKAQKQTRDFDESMLAVCQTCHVPIYEPLYNQRSEQIIGLYAGAFGGAYGGGIVAGGYRARSERYKTTEK